MKFPENAGDTVPFANAYWVIPCRFLAGDCPLAEDADATSRRLAQLVEHGIRHFIDLTEPGELYLFDTGSRGYGDVLGRVAEAQGVQVVYRPMPVKDFTAPMRKRMAEILDDIDQAIENGRPVYVHCRAGIGRTGTVVGCYLARHGYAEGQAVLEALRNLRRHTGYALLDSPQSGEQIEMVLSWVEGE